MHRQRQQMTAEKPVNYSPPPKSCLYRLRNSQPPFRGAWSGFRCLAETNSRHRQNLNASVRAPLCSHHSHAHVDEQILDCTYVGIQPKPSVNQPFRLPIPSIHSQAPDPWFGFEDEHKNMGNRGRRGRCLCNNPGQLAFLVLGTMDLSERRGFEKFQGAQSSQANQCARSSSMVTQSAGFRGMSNMRKRCCVDAFKPEVCR